MENSKSNPLALDYIFTLVRLQLLGLPIPPSVKGRCF